MKRVMLAVVACVIGSAVAYASPDVMRCAQLRNVRLLGHPAEKMNNFFFQRMMTPFAQKDVFGEARNAFVVRDDDERLVDGKRVGGLWRGEFWGKLMLGTARVADYLQDEKLLKFVSEESHRLMALQDDDGYLGSYTDKELVAIRDVDAAKKAYGWNTVWNLWNRKYAIWGLFMAYKVTGDKAILKSVEKQMDQWIDMMHKLKIPLIETGQPEKVGLPSMSILKPLLILYVETGNKRYLDYAKELVSDWDRADGKAPNFYRNAKRADDLYTWYPNPQRWGKCYEMMSCLDGILEYYRVTGDKRSLDTVIAIRENLFRSEANPLGGVGYCDQFYHAARRINAVNEICDTIHWIRLNLDLYLITGNVKYVDAMELCYFNAFMASVFRNGQWTAFAVRGHGRHIFEYQCGYAYNQCCVNNIPRTYMDIASSVVTRDKTGGFHVNMYQDATVEFDGVKFGISGNYPVGNKVVVTVESAQNIFINFRVPGWCPKLTINGKASCGKKLIATEAKAGKTSFVLEFDMNARIVNRPLACDPDADDENHWVCRRYTDSFHKETLSKALFRKEAAAQIMHGPLILAKSKRVGEGKEQIFNPFTVNGKGYSLKLSTIPAANTWGAWDVELSKPGAQTIRVKAGDFQSAGDDPLPPGADAFSIWF